MNTRQSYRDPKDGNYKFEEYRHLEYQDRAVLYIDILGFKDLVKDHNCSDLRNFIEYNIFENLKNMFGVRFPKLKVALYSDSLLLWTEGLALDKSFELLSYCASAIQHNSLLSHNNNFKAFCYRGSITIGKIHIENLESSFIVYGPAFLDCAAWEKKQEWIGISIPPENLQYLQKTIPGSFELLKQLDFFVEYEVPVKPKKLFEIKNLFRLENPFKTKIKTIAINPLHNLADSLLNCVSNTPESKRRNTSNFISYLKESKKVCNGRELWKLLSRS